MSAPVGVNPPPRADPLLPNTWLVAKREYLDRIRARLFHVSTLMLATLAVLVAFTPIFVRLVDRGGTTTIAVQAEEPALVQRSIAVMTSLLNATSGGGRSDTYAFVAAPDGINLPEAVSEGRYNGAIIATRDASGRIDFRFLTGEGVGADRAQLVGIGTLGIAILNWTSRNDTSGAPPFQVPGLVVQATTGPNAGGRPLADAEFASR